MLGPFKSQSIAEHVCDLVGGGDIAYRSGAAVSHGWVVLADNEDLTMDDIEVCAECEEWVLSDEMRDVSDLPWAPAEWACKSCEEKLWDQRHVQAELMDVDYHTDRARDAALERTWREEGVYGVHD